jgi:transcriptional regulator with XRE-family HTH domain
MTEIYAGERLHRLRKRRGLSLDEVSLGVGVTSSHISQIENGKRQPSFGLIAELADFFDVDPTFFIETRTKYYGHGRKVKRFREEKGIPLEELARLAHLDAGLMLEVEGGQNRLNPEELRTVAKVLERDLTEFNDCIEVHLERIREICEMVFDMTTEDTKEAVSFIRKKIRLEK